ncbi:MAG: UDP-N-acetylglucosamine--N-acetylmuramyl-(pentapeptide) pyrophosphoryl-undecaprenol N-acetylglucosamine transferase, partial [Verrucomicrobiales bacterium]
MSKKKKVIIACGGTGGHLFPGIAVAEELERQGHEVLLLISEKKVDAQSSEKYGELRFKTIPAIAKPATMSPKMIPFLFRLWSTVKQCRAIIKQEQADVVLGMGGFTSLPPVMAGKKMGLATFVHDSNAVPGKANRLTARWCRKVLLGFDEAKRFFPNSETVITGTPVRKELEQLPSQAEARAKYG